MKNQDLMILAGAAAFAWYLLKGKAALMVDGQVGAAEIKTNALPGQIGWGWRYYDDGTAIGPDGTYYRNGIAIWSP